MAKNKNQHFVPKVHLKQFASDAQSKQVDIWLPKHDQIINGASIRDQCSKSYLYGKDLELEEFFKLPEGIFGRLVRNVSAGGHASDTELETLKHLWLFQFVRSKRALTERLMIEAAMREKISIGQEDNPFLAEFFGQPLNEEGVLKSVLQSCDDFYATISDLKSVLLVNNCGEGFVLSDNPAVSSNKLVLMRFRNYGNWGLQSGGYYLFYPLTPKLALLAYDQSVYELRGRHVNCCEVNASDVRALNQLVYLHSDNLIILPNFGDQRKIIDNLKAVSEVKPDTLWRLNVAVKDDSRSTEERSVFLIATDEEFSKSGHGLVHVESVPPSVPRHLPRLKIKHAPKFVDTKSGSGLVRWSFRN